MAGIYEDFKVTATYEEGDETAHPWDYRPAGDPRGEGEGSIKRVCPGG
jgi:hypothetical protein